MPACFVVLRKVPLVALRKESVDRNIVGFPGVLGWLGSLSARRAWIEILCPLLMFCPFPVALRKESVDRNNGIPYSAAIRRAVALRKESVDRNKSLGLLGWLRVRRSPQGERG